MIAASLLAIATLTAAPAADDFTAVFPIETPVAQSADSAWSVELTPDVYAWTRDPALRDIEILNASGQPVPSGRLGAPPATARTTSRLLPVLALPRGAETTAGSDLRLVLDRDADGRLRRIDAGEHAAPVRAEARDWLIDASLVDRPIESLLVGWSEPVDGVVAQFSVEAGDDLEHWRHFGHATLIELDQNGAHLERREIPLGGARARYLRLHRIDHGVELAGLTASARTIELDADLPPPVWIEATPRAAAADDTIAEGTRFEFELPAALPVERARIALADDNALASLGLFARYPGVAGATWSRIAALTAFRLRQDGDTIGNGEIALRTAARFREFRIDSATPLASTPSLSLAYRPDRIVFLAEGSGPYRLAVARSHVRGVDYPIATALASLRARLGRTWTPPRATLGAGTFAHRVDSAPRGSLPWSRVALWIVLVAGAALVGGFAITLLRGASKPD